MDIVLTAVALCALLMAIGARKRAAGLEERLGEARRTATAAQATADELKESVDTLRALLGRMAGGHSVDALMVREGRLYKNTTSAELQKSLDEGRKPYVLDVRSSQEWTVGHIPGAVHVPVDDLEKSLHSVKRDGTPMYVICAGGGRSVAAAKFLSNRGYLNVFNVEGGMNGWRGPIARDG